MPPFSGYALVGLGAYRTEEGGIMKKHRDLNACLACLQQWQGDEALDLGQKEALDRVIRKLRKLSRHANPDRDDVLEVVRQISEILWKAFSRR